MSSGAGIGERESCREKEVEKVYFVTSGYVCIYRQKTSLNLKHPLRIRINLMQT